MRRSIRLVFLALVLFGAPLASHAHKPSDSYLTLGVGGAVIVGQWDIAVRDLDFALGIDADGDGNITWGELRTRHEDIAAYALGRLVLEADGHRCMTLPTGHEVDEHTDGAYEVLRFKAVCATAPQTLAVSYLLFFDIDAQHKGLLHLLSQGVDRSAIFSVDLPIQKLELTQGGFLKTLMEFGREGVWHIWLGFDHVLFLLSLLLPAVLVAGPGGWRPVEGFGMALRDVAKVVTAFTSAHSITLSLASLGVVSAPSRWVESAIALSVVLAALNNIWPFFRGRRWTVAFAFGLVHGFGFAAVLADLGLPRQMLATGLIGFNLGVEAGQMAIVAVFLPLAYALRKMWIYRRLVMVPGSALVAVLAGVWLMERAFALKLIPTV